MNEQTPLDDPVETATEDVEVEDLEVEDLEVADLDDIPRKQRDGFPTGVCEVTYKKKRQMAAFLRGLHFAQDIDVEDGAPFRRKGRWVVRVRVGRWP